jgi:hypothetical protein
MSSSSTGKREVAWAVLFAVATAGAVWVVSSMLLPAITHVSTFDFWFESDAPAIVKQLQDRWTLSNARTNRHPLFTIVLFPLVAGLRIATGPFTAMRLIYAGLAAGWAALFFLVVRGIGLRRGDAGLFALLAMVSAATMFWMPVPETMTPAAITLLVALGAVVWHERTGRLSWIGCALVAAVTLSMTTTNAVAGVLVCLVVLGARRGAAAFAAAVLLVIAGQGVERLLFPHTAAFFLPEARESAYVFNALAGTLGDRLVAFFLSSVVLPPVSVGYTAYLTAQRVELRSLPLPVIVAWGLWVGLLLVGMVGLMTRQPMPRRGAADGTGRGLAVVLLGTLASQLVLAIVFGQETFVYALQFAPLLALVAACGALTPWRRWVVAAAAVVVVLATFENGRRLTQAAALLQHRYDAAAAFAQAVSTLTAPADLLIVGLPPAAAEGLVPSPWNPSSRAGTLGRLPQFEATPLTRHGWHLSYERWSPEALEHLRQRGARYFVSDYAYGIHTHTGVRQYLDANGRALGGTTDWVVYALSPHLAARGATP